MNNKTKTATIAAILLLFFFNMSLLMYQGIKTEIAMLMSTLIIGFTLIVLWFTGNFRLGIE